MSTRPRPVGRPRTPRANPRRRLRVALVFFAIVLSLFAARLFVIQGLDASAYAAEANQHRTQREVLSAVRGTITDSSGVAFATTVEARDVTVDQTLVSNPTTEAAALAPYVGMTPDAVAKTLTGTARFAYVVKGIAPTTWTKIAALNLPGIYSQVSMKRVYPAGELAANLIGFVGADGHGLGGLEYGMDSQLAGHDGSATFEVGAGGQEIPTAADDVDAAVNGDDITLTINRDIQFEAQEAIAAQVKKVHADSGTVIVENPHTGAIYAMATVPSFDPNDAGAASPADRGNRALTDIYEPGSTSKVITMAAAINEGAVTPRTHITVPSSLTRGDRVFHDDVPHGIWNLTTTGVLARSSNLGAILTSERIGRAKLDTYLQRFGIGQPSGLGVQGESPGLLAPLSQWSDASAATIAFGQGLSVNAMQATDVFATIANNGVRVDPSVVQSYTLPDGKVVPAPAPKTHRVVTAKTAATLRQMMESVVSSEGTAPLAEIPGYHVAGKTGTANRVDPTCDCYRGYTASFIGMASADQPDLVVSVVLQNPRVGHFGGAVAAPVFRTVMGFALETLHIAPTSNRAPHFPLTFR